MLQIKGSFGSREIPLVKLEEAKLWDYDDPWNLVVIENQVVRSYEELCAVAAQQRYKDKEVLDIYFMHFAAGG